MCMCAVSVQYTFHTTMSTYSSDMGDIPQCSQWYICGYMYLANFAVATFTTLSVATFTVVTVAMFHMPSLYHSHSIGMVGETLSFVVLVHALCQPVMHVILCL